MDKELQLVYDYNNLRDEYNRLLAVLNHNIENYKKLKMDYDVEVRLLNELTEAVILSYQDLSEEKRKAVMSVINKIHHTKYKKLREWMEIENE